jgi:O-antigen/teichoic acid export membrane protein
MSLEARQEKPKPHQSFIRSVSVLVGGASVAHGITALALPILSRLYSPTDFSALAVFTALLSIISVAACLRFDVAVTIPIRDVDSANILALAIGCAFVISMLVAVPVLVFPEIISKWLNQNILQSYIWLLPVGVMLAATYSALQGWLVRKKEFVKITHSRLAQSSVAAGTQFGMGIAGFGPFGLLLGQVLNTGVACIVLGYRVIRYERDALTSVTWAGMRAMAHAYSRFPKFSTWESLSNSAAIQVPIIMIAATATGHEAGYLLMAMYVMQAPMALVGTAIGQVYLSRAPEEYRAERLGAFTAEVFGGLLKAGVGPLLFAGIVAPVAFPLVFGEDWRRAGDLVAWMTPWFVMQFIASPISMALHIMERQGVALTLQFLGLLIRVSSIWIAAVINNDYVSEVYAISGFLIYMTYCIVVLVISRIQIRIIKYQIYNSVKNITIWALLGLIVNIAITIIITLVRSIH